MTKLAKTLEAVLLATLLSACQGQEFAGDAQRIGGGNDQEQGNEDPNRNQRGRENEHPRTQRDSGLGGHGDASQSDKMREALGELFDTMDLSGSRDSGLDSADDQINGCATGPQTIVELLSPSVQNGVPGNKIEYGIYVVDCRGNKLPVTGKAILWDVDAYYEGGSTDLRYEARSTKGVIEGTLITIDGQDLFGNRGDDVFHNRTDAEISTDDASKVVRLTIHLGGTLFHPPSGRDAGPVENLQTYLRFGDAAPARQTVKFVKP